MDAEEARSFLLGLPHVVETVQWGNNLVFRVGDKAVGGKMFALIDLDGEGGPVLAFAAGAERFAELLEQDLFRPAPYLARAYWIAAESWTAFTRLEWRQQLTASHQNVLSRLTKKTRSLLASTEPERFREPSGRRAKREIQG